MEGSIANHQAIIEEEWEDGRLHGKAVQNSGDGDYEEFEAKGGNYSGKFIYYKNDGSC